MDEPKAIAPKYFLSGKEIEAPKDNRNIYERKEDERNFERLSPSDLDCIEAIKSQLRQHGYSA